MIESWLKPLTTEFLDTIKGKPSTIGQHIVINSDNDFSDLSEFKVVLIGVEGEASNRIRKSLYQLSDHFHNLKIFDLGNLRKPDEQFLTGLLQELLEGGLIPVLFGEKPEYLCSQFFASKAGQKTVNGVLISEDIPYSLDEDDALLNKLIHPDSGLFHLSLLAFQRHFTDVNVLRQLSKLHVNLRSLGAVLENLEEVEPILRYADFASFNISALKFLEAPAQERISPNGLQGDEACQLSRYLGFSDRLKSFSLLGYDVSKDENGLTKNLMAQMIWYFLDGVSKRKNDYPKNNKGMTEYLVHMDSHGLTISFWKSPRSGRWWMQVPVKTKKRHQQHRLVPCSYEDYKLAVADELPRRFFNTFKLFG